MRNIYRILAMGRRAVILGVLAALILGPGNFFWAAPASAAVASWQRGATVLPVSNTDFASANFEQSLRNLAATGANYVTLDIPVYQSNIQSTDVQNGWDTPTSQSLVSGIQFAHSIGLHVMLKFVVSSNDGQWSAYINPSDRSTWFANYKNTIMPFVSIAQANGVEEICIGNELISMTSDNINSTNAANWNALISSIRGAYSGKLTYGANWGESGFDDEKDNISFWPSLDYIGISAYFDLSGDGSVASLMSSWDSWNKTNIGPLQAKWGKPVLFTELGYKAIYDSYTHPWMWQENGSYDGNEQANDYQALFQYWDQVPYMVGVQLWFWSSNPNAGGAGDTDYTPQNKPAQDVMKQWFSSGSSGSVPPANPVFSVTASNAPTSPVAGQMTSFNINVANSGGAVFGANTDMEIYNSAGSRVFQQVFANQNFAANGSQSYTFSWNPSAADTYVLKVGLFNGNWSQLYYWDNQAMTIPVGSGGSSGTSTVPSSVNVWWPTNGTTVTGVQPFKAMVPGLSVDAYSMFWQVDGSQLNPMASNATDYPHKEASVDVTPWTWHGTGPYVVTFIAENASGQVIAKTSVSIKD